MSAFGFRPLREGVEHIAVYRDGPLGMPIAITWLVSGDLYDAIQCQPRSLDDRRMPRKPIARLIADLGHDIRHEYDYIPNGEILSEPVHTTTRIPVIWTF